MLNSHQLSDNEVQFVAGGNSLNLIRKVFEAAGIAVTLNDVSKFISSMGMPGGVPSGPSVNHVTVRQWYSIRDK